MFEFKMPDIGEGVIEGEVVRWKVKEGEAIGMDQPMVEVMTDKATVEIPSPRAGKIAKIMYLEGQICPVGKTLVTIDTGASAAAEPTVHGGHAKPNGGGAHMHTQVAAATDGAHGKVLAAPATRQLARELGIDLTTVRGTGPGGRVTPDDVRGHGGGRPSARTPEPAREPVRAPERAPVQPVSVPSVGAEAASRGTRLATLAEGPQERVPFRGMRRKIAENMARSKFTATHYTYVEEVDVTELVTLRDRARARAEERGVKLSYLPFIVKAVVSGLKKFPIVNSSLDEQKQELVLKRYYHVGIGAATDQGLVVTTVRDADKRSLFDLAAEIARLAQAAKDGKASRDELTGSTFTITSLGTLGGVLATPIINFPEVAILGVHKIAERAVVRDHQICIRSMMNLSISLDHRIVDGFEGAKFMAHVREYLEDPTLMFMEMV
jgi:pyruvate dehydrogenase E2 component (dihydrolipoamide acetyltransferase)